MTQQRERGKIYWGEQRASHAALPLETCSLGCHSWHTRAVAHLRVLVGDRDLGCVWHQHEKDKTCVAASTASVRVSDTNAGRDLGKKGVSSQDNSA
mmetsp:Transcript_12575/g.29535  ORF Transcript_12575/g.29535 Transcript_12575/m.29535 type:complete len:96 (+) Transcript_12575:895-1182(+)